MRAKLWRKCGEMSKKKRIVFTLVLAQASMISSRNVHFMHCDNEQAKKLKIVLSFFRHYLSLQSLLNFPCCFVTVLVSFTPSLLFHWVSLVWSIIYVTWVLLLVNDTVYMYIFPDYVPGFGLYLFLASCFMFFFFFFCLSSYLFSRFCISVAFF